MLNYNKFYNSKSRIGIIYTNCHGNKLKIRSKCTVICSMSTGGFYMIKVAICDDNVMFLNRFKTIIETCFSKFTNEFEIESVSNGGILLMKHRNTLFDIVFLDIDMPEMTGFEVARTLRDDFSNCFIIFVTSHAEFVYDSMDFQPFNFIRKNCNIPLEEATEKVIRKLIRHMKQNEKIILEDDISGRKAVYLKDIIYIENDKHYLYFHILNANEPIKMRGNMADYEEKYNRYDFIRIHKKYLVNMRFIQNIDSGSNKIVLRGVKAVFPMSRSQKKSVSEKYTLFMRSMI